MWTAFWAALSTALVGIVNALLKSRKENPLVAEAHRVGAAEAELQLKAQADAEVAKTTKTVDDFGPVLNDPDGLRDYAERDPNNRDTWPGGDNKG